MLATSLCRPGRPVDARRDPAALQGASHDKLPQLAGCLASFKPFLRPGKDLKRR